MRAGDMMGGAELQGGGGMPGGFPGAEDDAEEVD